ncbi:MAG: hypothetical protein E6H87_14295 [Chloroflexi bacterium]|nr:MAG: hypothetical protein E6H87_14295 [Chloroflexota bacterium]
MAAEDETNRRARGRRLSNIVAGLTGAHLQDEPAWSRYWWVDDLLEDSIETIAPLTVEIRGDLVWGDGRHDWTMPFRGRISLAEPADLLASYEFELANAATGLQKVGYSDRRFEPRTDPTEWLFTFRSRN